MSPIWPRISSSPSWNSPITEEPSGSSHFSTFTRVLACQLAESPKTIRYIRGFDGFVTSSAAPIAPRWSNRSPDGNCTHGESPTFAQFFDPTRYRVVLPVIDSDKATRMRKEKTGFNYRFANDCLPSLNVGLYLRLVVADQGWNHFRVHSLRLVINDYPAC